jgi:hypothetical protein
VISTLLYYRSPWTLANFGEGIVLKSLFEMRTGTAVAAVRGTQWRGEVTPLKRWAEQRVSRLFRATEPL